MFLLPGMNGKRKQPGNELSDEQLIESYLDTGNKELIGLLFERYTPLVYGLCLHYLDDHEQCKDAVMEIFESLFEKLAVHQVSCFKNWLYSVARNHCLMLIRKAAGAERMRRKAADTQETYVLQPEQNTADAELLLHEAVAQLADEQRLCLSMLYLEDKSYRDISETTGYSLNQVKSYVQNGKRNLKNLMLSRYEPY
jgi:RNA polymerase sigma factor (sigma-70 family)